jgi:hypothetical protein
LLWAIFSDVGLTEIVSPVDTVDSGAIVRPRVNVWNYGSQTEFVTATFCIPDEGYLRQSRVLVPSHEEIQVAFATWIPRQLGVHAMRCSLSLDGDIEPSNDTIGGYVVVAGAAGVAEAGSVPPRFQLDVPRPSVFGRNVTIAYALPSAAEVSLSVYDATGKLVKELRRETAASGEYRLVWDGRNEQGRTIPAGTYFCRLAAGEYRSTAVLVKL